MSSAMLTVYDGQRCAGFLLSRGPLGWEAFFATEESLGIFRQQHEAAEAVTAAVAKAA
jgi:hypothetical protein